MTSDTPKVNANELSERYDATKDIVERACIGSEAIEALRVCERALTKFETAKMPGQWILVSERLPEPDEWVLVHNGKWRGVAHQRPMDGFWEESERWQSETGEFVEHLGPKVIGWQPLPPLPEPTKGAQK